MATKTATRTVSRKTFQPGGGHTLPASQPTEILTGLLIGALGLVGYGLAASGIIETGHEWSILVGALSVGACVFVIGLRARHRNQLQDRLVEALTRVTGYQRPERRNVSLGRWTWRWPGHPRRVVVRYHPACEHTAAEWTEQIIEITDRRLDERYKIIKHKPRRAKLVLATKTTHDRKEKPEDQQRAERAMGEILGPTAKIKDVQWDADGDIKSIDVTHDNGVKVAIAPYRRRVEGVVTEIFPGRWRSKWDLEADRVQFEQRPPLPTLVPHPPPSDQNPRKQPIAVGEDGETICWDMNRSPHGLIAGTTGGGKTVIMNGIIMEAARHHPVFVVDPKRIEFLGLRQWPNVRIVATKVEEQIATIRYVHKEMERRYEAIEHGIVDENDLEPWLLVLDEYRDFASMVTAWWNSTKIKGMKTKPDEIFEWISSLARKGRSGRIALMVGTQRPDVSGNFLSGELRDNFSFRVSASRLSASGAQMLWEGPHGTSLPMGIPGRCTAVNDQGHITEAQAYWTPEPRRAIRDQNPADLEILRNLWPAKTRFPKMEIVFPKEVLTPTDDDGMPTGEPARWMEAIEAAEWVESADVKSEQLRESLEPKPKLSGLQQMLVTAHTDPDLALPPPAEPPVTVEEQYLPESRHRVSDIQPGDMIQLDDDERWVVADVVERDEDTEQIMIDWRDEDRDYGTICLDEDQYFDVRRMADSFTDTEEEAA